MITTPAYKFYNSFNSTNRFQPLQDFLKAYSEQKNNNHFVVTEIPFSQLDKWKFINEQSIEHESGKFFKIEGLKIKTNYGDVNEWKQPIINQPEIGILGIITKVFDGVRYFLMQLKMEPGNVNILQLSPTVQATKSNFSKVHKGKSVLFLEYFIDKTKSKILIDQLQSEQGGRFIRKRNRNMVVEITDDIETPENFFWLTLSEIKGLLRSNNFVNMDARSVISTIPLPITFGYPLHSDEEIFNWYIDQKVKYELEVEKIPLSDLKTEGWTINPNNIFKSDRFFSVIAVKVETGNREVSMWTQPLIKDLNVGLVGFIVKDFNKVPHYLVQAKVMPGNIDIIDLSPTVSVSNFKYALSQQANKPFFIDYFLKCSCGGDTFNTLQSEEGGRFYHLQNINKIVKINDNEKLDIPDNYIWLTRDQINKFMPYGMFNIEARSLISMIR